MYEIFIRCNRKYLTCEMFVLIMSKKFAALFNFTVELSEISLKACCFNEKTY